MVIWPEASSAQSSMGTVSVQGRTVCVLMRRRNSSFCRSIALVVRADFHCDGSRRVKAVYSFYLLRRPAGADSMRLVRVSRDLDSSREAARAACETQDRTGGRLPP